MMIAQLQGISNDIDVDFPITRIEYSVEDKDFYYVEKYTENMMKKQEKLMSKLARLN